MRPFTHAFAAFTLVAPLRGTPVINEIHYNNDDNTVFNEFVEIHNPDPVAADLGGWRLDGAVRFTFPANTTIPAGGYLVIGEDPATIASEFGVAAIGPYQGALNSEGELLQLLDGTGAEIDRVDYGVGFPWPTRAKGEGSSMELINPALDNDLGSSWRSSSIGFNGNKVLFISEGDTWRYRKGLSEASSPIHDWTKLDFTEDETWLTGPGPLGRNEPLVVTNLQDAQGNYSSVFLRKTFTFNGVAPSSALLRILYDDGVIVWLNGTEIFRSESVDAGVIDYQGNTPANAGGNGTAIASDEQDGYEEYAIGGTSNLIQQGQNVLAIQLFNDTVGSSDILIDAVLETPEPFSELAPPSPGRANNSSTSSPPPNIRQVEHSPAEPGSSDPVTISAKVTDPDGVESVALEYQVVAPGSYVRISDPAYETSWTGIEMTAAEGDGSIYSAVIPGQAHRHLVRYRITVTDTLGAGVTVPFDDDEQPNFAYFVYDGIPAWTGASNPGNTPAATFSPGVLEEMPTYHLISNATDVTNSQYNSGSDGVHMKGTLIYDGTVYDHIEFENRGEASTYQSGKNKWRFHFNTAREFEARDNWGNKYEKAWDTMNFNACASPWAPVHRGMAGVEEAVSFRLYELAGIASPRTHHVHFRVIDNSAESSNNQYESDLWGLYLVVEHPDGAFLDNRNLPDGNTYKIEGGNGDQKHQARDQPSNNSDWNAFRAASNSTQNEAYWRSNMNLPAYYAFRAGNRITGNVDVREGFNHYFYNNPESGWTVVPWDLDMMFIAETHWSGTIQQKACLNIPVLGIEYRNKAREMFDLLCSDSSIEGGQMAQLIDEYAQLVNPVDQPLTWSDVDEYMWNYHPRTRGNPNVHSGQGNHKGNWFYSPFTDSRIGGSYVRTLVSSDHEGSMQYLTNYVSDTFTGGTWIPGNGRQDGYGYEFLKRDANDPAIPDTPTITYTGDAEFSATGLSFESSAFSDPQGNGSFSAMQWRIGGIGINPDQPNTYEIEDNWSSTLISPFQADITPPALAVRPGQTYRARVRHQDTTGRWSHWSEPFEFTAGQPNIDTLQQSLVISEIMFNPDGDDATEFIELFNSGDTDLDLTNVRFTKGIDYDFPVGFSLAAGSYVVVAKNAAAFQAKYGIGIPLAPGEYDADSLSNGGELLKLSLGTLAIHEFEYNDDYPWPELADGEGYSLILSHVSDQSTLTPNDPLGHGLASQWRQSSAIDGSPGESDPTERLVGGPSIDDDGDGLDALLEHFFGTSDDTPSAPLSVSVSGGQASLTFPINPLADDVSHLVEFTSDLENWTILSNLTARTISSMTYTTNLPTPQSKLFFRVRVQQVEAIPR
ncbi:lamin tail domain-containing protein [Akkermansiaceae bacterium]|nr:lamin tail domain-containing protein [Akkermansiaceae bacterium]